LRRSGGPYIPGTVNREQSIESEEWSIEGHADWFLDYESALNILATDLKA